jgi:hypothetical protein
LNAFDKSRISITAWCEDCECVFDNNWEVEAHRQDKGHRVRVTEFWVTGRR